MMESVPTVGALAKADPSEFGEGKKTIFRGIGPATRGKFSERARLLAKGPDAKPYLKEPLEQPSAPVELFFDIEVDPMRDHCYLHGFVERRNGDSNSERFVSFFAEGATEKAEKEAFEQAWDFMRASRPCAIYYYAPMKKPSTGNSAKNIPTFAPWKTWKRCSTRPKRWTCTRMSSANTPNGQHTTTA